MGAMDAHMLACGVANADSGGSLRQKIWNGERGLEDQEGRRKDELAFVFYIAFFPSWPCWRWLVSLPD